MNPLAIRLADPSDARAVADIYNHYIRDTVVTFEEAEVTPAEMALRIDRVAGDGLPWLVATDGDVVVGYAYAAKWHGRSAYRYSVESTIYLRHDHAGRGVGRELYGRLLATLRAGPVHAVVGMIALPNPASIALHERLGFARVGQLTEIGFKFGRWVDVGYWQVTF